MLCRVSGTDDPPFQTTFSRLSWAQEQQIRPSTRARPPDPVAQVPAAVPESLAISISSVGTGVGGQLPAGRSDWNWP